MIEPGQIEIDEETCDIVVGSLLWHAITEMGMVEAPGGSGVDTRLCLDVLCRCEEQMLKPDPGNVTRFVAGVLHHRVPDLDMVPFEICVTAAADLIAALCEA